MPPEADNPDFISIHAPREGSDWHHADKRDRIFRFLSTLPARGATRACR